MQCPPSSLFKFAPKAGTCIEVLILFITYKRGKAVNVLSKRIKLKFTKEKHRLLNISTRRETKDDKEVIVKCCASARLPEANKLKSGIS